MQALGRHTIDYLRCLMNPLHSGMTGAPGLYNPPSWKVRTIQRFQMGPGTSQFGAVAVYPSVCNDHLNIFYTNTAYANANFVADDCSNISNSDLPYSTAQMAAANIRARVVSAVLTVTYFGTELNLNGIYSTLTEPNHDSLDGYDINSVQAYSECKIIPVSRNKVAVHFLPLQSDLEFVKQDALPGAPYMAIFVYATEQQPFYCEFAQVVEYEGKTIRSKTSNLEVDHPQGMKALTVVASNSPTSGIQGPPPTDSFGKQVLDVAKKSVVQLLAKGAEALVGFI